MPAVFVSVSNPRPDFSVRCARAWARVRRALRRQRQLLKRHGSQFAWPVERAGEAVQRASRRWQRDFDREMHLRALRATGYSYKAVLGNRWGEAATVPL